MHDGAPVGVETELDALWASVPCPTVVVDRAGIVRTVSASAESVLPDTTPGARLEDAAAWLSRAHDRLAGATPDPADTVAVVVSGSLAGRKFDPHAAVLPSGEVVVAG
ncbi:hypothetical protein [Mycobacterium sp. 050134]|uniref:hypothetical protein n=1 Tax=Mycobacterium sp. 050134 TaxID=3096111 RepID=UPI003FA52EFF